MGDEHREVDGPYDALACEVRIPMGEVVVGVIHQKQRRRRERSEHQLHVQLALTLFDRPKSYRDQRSARAVQDRVDHGKPCSLGSAAISLVEVDKPDEKAHRREGHHGVGGTKLPRRQLDRFGGGYHQRSISAHAREACLIFHIAN